MRIMRSNARTFNDEINVSFRVYKALNNLFVYVFTRKFQNVQTDSIQSNLVDVNISNPIQDYVNNCLANSEYLIGQSENFKNRLNLNDMLVNDTF